MKTSEPRRYAVMREGRLYEVVTVRRVPRLCRFSGMECSGCGAMYPKEGSIDSAMRSGCIRCHGNVFVNVYEDVDDIFKLGEERWQR